MTETITKKALKLMGAPRLVYVREVLARDILSEIVVEDGVELDPDAVLYTVNAADGSRLAVLESRAMAIAAARGHELDPVSVH